MRPASHFDDPVPLIEPVITGIGVGLQESGELLEMGSRTLPLAIGAVEECDRRRRHISARAVVAQIHPYPPRRGAARSRRQHRKRRIVSVDLGRCEDMLADPLGQGPQQPGHLADPAHHRAAIELDPGARVDARLSIERNMIAILRHQHLGQQTRTGQPALDRQGWCRSLQHCLTAAARQSGPDMPDHPETTGNVIEDLGMILADDMQPSVTARAARSFAGSLDGPRRIVAHNLSRQMAWQRPADRMELSVAVIGDRRQEFGWQRRIGLAGRIEIEDELPGMALRGMAKLHPLQSRDDLLELRVLQLAELKPALQFADRIGEFLRPRQQRCGVRGPSLVVAIHAPDFTQRELRNPEEEAGSRRFLRRSHRRRSLDLIGYGAPPIHTLDQHRELGPRQAHRAVAHRRPNKLSLLQPLGKQT